MTLPAPWDAVGAITSRWIVSAALLPRNDGGGARWRSPPRLLQTENERLVVERERSLG